MYDARLISLVRHRIDRLYNIISINCYLFFMNTNLDELDSSWHASNVIRDKIVLCIKKNFDVIDINYPIFIICFSHINKSIKKEVQ